MCVLPYQTSTASQFPRQQRSTDYATALAKSRHIHALAIRTALLLSDYARSKGHAWPHVRTLCQRLGCSKAGLLKALKELVKAGAIQIAHRAAGRGSVYVMPWSPL
jgi:DNA-binding GntR family transcriptional regulator